MLAQKRSLSSTTTTAEDRWQRGYKSSPYRDQRYEVILAGKGVFMHDSELGITRASESLCRSLLEKQQTVPKESLFRDDIFETTRLNLSDKNEARVIQDISRLIVPSPETLATFVAEHLSILTESVDEAWTNSIPFTQPRPQPDFAVGFKEEAFTKDQLSKLSPFIGDYLGEDESFFMATYRMFSPFLTCEVKCAASSINIADRQNTHSAALAVQAIVKLIEAVQRKKRTPQTDPCVLRLA
ncbi:uncharacterized protein DNG_06283 [Cephalotrichum gorgonifer]|uniref:DUF7924 domain-containing protein n=1 Tax=Cephalotrichum gorgonifer TaxID=2041049 RepID=A0AAE8SWA3_9PEZI|nr:uncharacterized protein DNG_06283 [Cephalotrichum gorgonifer]